MPNTLGLHTDLSLRLYLRALSGFVYELMEAMGCTGNFEQVLELGVHRNQVISRASVDFIDLSERVVARVRFSFDWETGLVTVSSGAQGAIRALDFSQPISSQIHTVLREMVEDIAQDARSKFDGVWIRVLYWYTDEVANDPARVAYWRKQLGLCANTRVYDDSGLRKLPTLRTDEFGDVFALGLWVS